MKAIAVGVQLIWGLLLLLTLFAMGRNSVALSGIGTPRFEGQVAAPSVSALPPSLQEYVFLHETRNLPRGCVRPGAADRFAEFAVERELMCETVQNNRLGRGII